jgi:hypothetical protein
VYDSHSFNPSHLRRYFPVTHSTIWFSYSNIISNNICLSKTRNIPVSINEKMAPPFVLALLAIPTLTLANINFTWIQPHCSPKDTFSHCLKGQTCKGTTCVPDYTPPVNYHQTVEKRSLPLFANPLFSKRDLLNPLITRQAVRTDNRCGPSFANAPCATGSCCSSSG